MLPTTSTTSNRPSSLLQTLVNQMLPPTATAGENETNLLGEDLKTGNGRIPDVVQDEGAQCVWYLVS